MPSTYQTTTYETVLPQDDDILYEVVDGKIVVLGPMGAHEIWLATVLARHLGNFVIQGESCRSYCLISRRWCNGNAAQMWLLYRTNAGRGSGLCHMLRHGRWYRIW